MEKLQLHSPKVGLTYYDKTASTLRASFITQLSQKECQDEDSHEISEEVRRKRKERDLADDETVVKKAKERLLKDKLKKVETRSRTCKLMNKERQFMMELFSPIISANAKDDSFPCKLCLTGTYLISNFLTS